MNLLILNTDEKEFSYGGVCPFMRNMHPYLDEAFELKYITLPQLWKTIPGSTRIKYLVYLWMHKRQLKKADFVLSHGPEGSYVASFTGVPYAHVYHGNSNPMSISRFKIGKYFARLYDRMFARIEKTASLVYTVGPARNEKQKKLYNPLKQDVKPLPIGERAGFVFAGRLEAMKNVDRLITIYSKLPDDIKRNNPFYIAGYGTQEENLRRKARECENEIAPGKVIFLGKIDNTQMLATDADKKILIMASSTEGMPTAIAEAFSVGLPVVSTAVGDIPSVVKEGVNGYLLPLEYKDEEYVETIVRIMNEYDRFAKAAYESSVLFDGERISNGVINDINAFLSNK